jgi:2-amino-4-hydroxy-6-hydroxymethyldihydropteridine diphosphokinase
LGVGRWTLSVERWVLNGVMRAGVALGSNLGDSHANLSSARAAIGGIPGVLPPLNVSAIYETEPVGCEPGAPSFLNAVVEFGYNGDPVQLFKELRDIEIALGRPAEHQRNVSRPIDIDLLYCGDSMIETEHLTLPHPRIAGRRFVLQPLADVAPELVLPGENKSVRELLASAPQSARVLRSDLEWDVP